MNYTNKILLSGWATKDWTLSDVSQYLSRINPKIFEISKDFAEGSVSLKKIYSVLNSNKTSINFELSYAGTSNIVECSNLPFETYLKYLNIQFSEAQFLGCSMFRLLLGHSTELGIPTLISRLNEIRKLGCELLIEIHNGWESETKNLEALVSKTDCMFIIDFQNLYESPLSLSQVKNIPKDRVKYFHTRNLGNQYNEHPESTELEKELTKHNPTIPVMWEPKKIFKSDIKDLYYEHQQTY